MTDSTPTPTPEPTPARTEEELAADKEAEEKAALEAKEKEKAGEPAPVTADDIKLPDGMEVNETLQTEFLEVFNKGLVGKELAQALVDMQGKAMQEVSESANRLWQETQTKWKETIHADPDLGGDKIEATLSVISKSLDEFGDKETREAFTLTGAGNNPAIVKYIHKMAVALSEGKPVTGQPATGEQTQAEKLYPSQGK